MTMGPLFDPNLARNAAQNVSDSVRIVIRHSGFVIFNRLSQCS
jgi:hypothetical protein